MPLRPPAGFIRPGYDPLKVPNAPTSVTATAGTSEASVAFTAPTNVGGSAITNYYAVSSPGGFVGSSATSPITVTGLTNGTAYTFTVFAENSFGPGVVSAASNSVTPQNLYVEDVFSTYLYNGNGAPNTINNGIDLAGKGGMVWAKARTLSGGTTVYGTGSNILYDTNRGINSAISSNRNNAADTQSGHLTAFNSNGFSLAGNWEPNEFGYPYVSWTFREQPKFFDVVTYTGNGIGPRAIAHNLGSAPGCIIVKKTSATQNWAVYHRSVGTSQWLILNSTSAAITQSVWGDTTPTSTNFYVSDTQDTNGSGQTYVAYLFAHDAGGFGASGSDNVITCGSFTVNASNVGQVVTLGYEPQFILLKSSGPDATNWEIFDNMRGMPLPPESSAVLYPNQSAAEGGSEISISATGFQYNGFASNTYIYIAIRRGPMKTPTSGTSVFFPQAYADISLGTSNPTTLGASAGFPVDFFMHSIRTDPTFCANIFDRLRGSNPALLTSSTAAEDTGEPLNGYSNAFDTMSGVKSAYNNRYYYYSSAAGTRSHIGWFMRRAPSFMDVVCYTGTGSARTVNHNLGVAPELMIVKNRPNPASWAVYSPIGATKVLTLNTTNAETTFSGSWNNTAPTASVFTVGTATGTNGSGVNYVAYLFASCPGVSKVGTYTGTGTTQQINCGFTAGARFVLIKRTDSTGDWYVWDSARGIVAGDDPYLLLNSTAAEVTNTDYVDTYSAGFEISSTAPAAINANGGTFIFLAIA
jgi:hypothetical protein